MKEPTLTHGIIIAIVFSALAVPIQSLLFSISGTISPTATLIAILSAAYILYLLIIHGRGTGRISLCLIGSVIITMLLVLQISTVMLGFCAIVTIFAIRALLRYSSFLCAGLDLGLCLVASGAALWALAHGGIIVAIWCFLLIQALHVLIPSRFGPAQFSKDPTSASGRTRNARFNEAWQAAASAHAALTRRAI